MVPDFPESIVAVPVGAGYPGIERHIQFFATVAHLLVAVVAIPV